MKQPRSLLIQGWHYIMIRYHKNMIRFMQPRSLPVWMWHKSLNEDVNDMIQPQPISLLPVDGVGGTNPMPRAVDTSHKPWFCGFNGLEGKKNYSPTRILTVLLYMVLHGSHQYTPLMLAYIPAPWILWVGKPHISWENGGFPVKIFPTFSQSIEGWNHIKKNASMWTIQWRC